MDLIYYLLFFNGFMLKVSWCCQHFLTMEFYRKICNKCYWSNVYSSKHSIVKNILIIGLSFLTAMFFSFFYLPTDPANSNRNSYYRKVINFLSGFKLSLQNLLNCISNQIIIFASSVINLQNIKFHYVELFKLKSALQI